ncbi:MAG: hypothetical protein COB93_03450 [Sneathiella sp.]|nr:MAG: hypothetical protein COB93_03450 [Sneathiella sp.]
MTDGIHPDVLPQLADLVIDPTRPLIITDADEVLFNFMVGLEGFLSAQNLFFDWSSFALSGNIRRTEDLQPIDPQAVGKLLSDFFETCCATLPAVDGAAKSLATLSQHAQIIVLSNVPPQYAKDRREGLVDKNMDYPLIANIGSKGQVVRHLTEGLKAPSFFIDDIPHNHSSVNLHAAHVHRLHYVADERLSDMLGQAEDSHTRLYSWPDIEAHIIKHIETGEY